MKHAHQRLNEAGHDVGRVTGFEAAQQPDSNFFVLKSIGAIRQLAWIVKLLHVRKAFEVSIDCLAIIRVITSLYQGSEAVRPQAGHLKSPGDLTCPCNHGHCWMLWPNPAKGPVFLMAAELSETIDSKAGDFAGPIEPTCLYNDGVTSMQRYSTDDKVCIL